MSGKLIFFLAFKTAVYCFVEMVGGVLREVQIRFARSIWDAKNDPISVRTRGVVGEKRERFRGIRYLARGRKDDAEIMHAMDWMIVLGIV